MKVFDFDPAAYRAEFAELGYVHIREGVTAEFHEYLLRFVEELAAHRLPELAGTGDKEQALLEFPDGFDLQGELFAVVADATGLDRDTMVISERHIKAYDENANPEPIAHKDRYGSQVSVGLSIRIPDGASLVLYPDDHVAPNPFNSAAELASSLQPDERPDVALKTAREVEIHDQDRDVVMFRGSETWHLRRRGAGVVNLYLKFNDFGSDPLGEDPHTDELRAGTIRALESSVHLDETTPVLSRRLDTVGHIHTRDWWEFRNVRVYGAPPFGITSLQFEALRLADGRRSLGDLIRSVAGGDDERARHEVLGLAERGALDLVR